jgi:hypothetical protein
MKRFGTCSCLALLALLFGGLASANILVVNCGTVNGPTELTSAAILCPQFNLLGQTLSNISIAVSGGIAGTITLTNSDNATQTGSGTSTTGFNFGALSGFTFVNPIYSPSFTTGSRSLNAGQTLTVSGLTGNGNGTLGNDNTIFAPYTGGGNFSSLTSTSTFFSSGGTGGAFSAAQSSTANATAVVTYTYSATASTPEPPPCLCWASGYSVSAWQLASSGNPVP